MGLLSQQPVIAEFLCLLTPCKSIYPSGCVTILSSRKTSLLHAQHWDRELSLFLINLSLSPFGLGTYDDNEFLKGRRSGDRLVTSGCSVEELGAQLRSLRPGQKLTSISLLVQLQNFHDNLSQPCQRHYR